MSMSAIESIRSKVLQRNGKAGIRMLVRTIRSSPAAAEVLRVNLRDIGLFISDADFAELVQLFGTAGGASFDSDRLVAAVIGKFVSRRETVLAVTTEKLDPARRGYIDGAVLRAAYDVSRHPEVLARRLTASAAEAQFLQAFESDVTTEEFLAYYAGVSTFMADDKAFDLLLIRQWSLDRPKIAAADQLEDGTAASAAPAGKTGKLSHPLYQTSASNIGTRLDHGETETKHNRTAIFTRFAPPPQAGSGLNTATTTTRV